MKLPMDEYDEICRRERTRIMNRRKLPKEMQHELLFLDCLRMRAREMYVGPLAPNLTEDQKTYRRGKAAYDLISLVSHASKRNGWKTAKDAAEHFESLMKQEGETPDMFCVYRGKSGKEMRCTFTEAYAVATTALEIMKDLQKGGAK